MAAPAPSPPAGSTEAVAKGVVEVGRVFGEGGTDGLILYALIIATALMFVVAMCAIIMGYRAIAARDAVSAADRKAFTDAATESADALREVATALASSASADSTFKASLAGVLGRLEVALLKSEGRRRNA